MDYHIIEILSYSIALPAILSLVKFKTFDVKFIPFLLFVWLGLLTEVFTTVMINSGYSNAAISNCYVLVEAMLILWQFKNWKLFDKAGKYYPGFVSLLGACWLAENLIFSSITRFNPYFKIVYSFSIVLMSIVLINRLIVSERKSLLQNPVFLACFAFVAFFTYKVLVEIFWLYGLNGSSNFRSNVYDILTFINLFANILYALATLWIPRKREYSLL